MVEARPSPPVTPLRGEAQAGELPAPGADPLRRETAPATPAEAGPAPDTPLTDTAVPDAGTDVLGPALAAQAARDPRWPEALAQARWALRIGQRRRRPDGTVEDWVDPETRAELERRGRLRLAVYDAADAFVAREGRAPNKREQRQLVARVIVEEEETQQAWDAATAAFARNDREDARRWLRQVAQVGQVSASDRPSASIPSAATESPIVEDVGNQNSVPSATQPVSGAAQRRLNRLKWRDRLGASESNLRELVNGWRLRGWNRAADLLEKFLNQDDSLVVVSREEAREIEFVQNAEETNNNRIINDTFTGQTEDPSITAELRVLGDGEKRQIRDHYVDLMPSLYSKLQGALSFTEEELLGEDRTKEMNEALSYGGFHVRSEVVFYAERHGDEIRITGEITHSMRDIYDFGRYGPGRMLGAYDLQEVGRGTPFEIEGAWKQEVKGTVKILGSELVVRDGKRVREHILGNPEFRIRDVE